MAVMPGSVGDVVHAQVKTLSAAAFDLQLAETATTESVVIVQLCSYLPFRFESLNRNQRLLNVTIAC
jgi:hypothetical protein